MNTRNALRRLTGRDQLQTILSRLDRQHGRLAKLENASRRAARDDELHAREINRIAHQLAALETKVEDLRQRLAPVPEAGSPDEVDRARTLVDEIRTEHQRVRVRLSAVTTYEERLRRIEEKIGLPHD